jgi:transglutaminase-like putative cysteine protease
MNHPAASGRDVFAVGNDQARYYAAPSVTSDLSRQAAALRLLPGTPAEAGRWARNAVLHVQDVARAGLAMDADRIEDFRTRSASAIVERVLTRDGAPLSARREPVARMTGGCYHFSLLACAFLRHTGVPARLRYGFAPYLKPGMYEDHCIVEVLLGGRWRRFDPRYALEVDDDDPKTFLGGADAWRMCRSGGVDPDLFGTDDMLSDAQARGIWYVRNNLVRDFASLCKVELHPWDWWGLMTAQEDERPDSLIDELAALMLDDGAWADRAARFEIDPLLRPGAKVAVFGELGDVFREAGEVVLPWNW